MKRAPVKRVVYLNGNAYSETLIWYKGKYIPQAEVPKKIQYKVRGASRLKVSRDFFKSILHKLPTAELARLGKSIIMV